MFKYFKNKKLKKEKKLKEDLRKKENMFYDILSKVYQKDYCECCLTKKDYTVPVSSAFGAFTCTLSCMDCYNLKDKSFVSVNEFITIFSVVSLYAFLNIKKSRMWYDIDQLKRTYFLDFNAFDIFVENKNKRIKFIEALILMEDLKEIKIEEIRNFIKENEENIDKTHFFDNEFGIGFEFVNKDEKISYISTKIYYKIEDKYFKF